MSLSKKIKTAAFCCNCNKSKSLCECTFKGYKYALWESTVEGIFKEFIKELKEFLGDKTKDWADEQYGGKVLLNKVDELAGEELLK